MPQADPQRVGPSHPSPSPVVTLGKSGCLCHQASLSTSARCSWGSPRPEGSELEILTTYHLGAAGREAESSKCLALYTC